jgi:hypothetical protein
MREIRIHTVDVRDVDDALFQDDEPGCIVPAEGIFPTQLVA